MFRHNAISLAIQRALNGQVGIGINKSDFNGLHEIKMTLRHLPLYSIDKCSDRLLL